MWSLGWQETMVIFLLALVIFGPKKLPELGKNLAKGLNEFRRASSELKATFDREMATIERETGDLKEVSKEFHNEVQNYDSSYDNSYYDSGYGYDSGSQSTSQESSTISASATQGADSKPATETATATAEPTAEHSNSGGTAVAETVRKVQLTGEEPAPHA